MSFFGHSLNLNAFHRKRGVELENRANAVYLSSISVAEIMIKASLGKLEFNHDPIACAEELGFEPLRFFFPRCDFAEETPVSPSRSL